MAGNQYDWSIKVAMVVNIVAGVLGVIQGLLFLSYYFEYGYDVGF